MIHAIMLAILFAYSGQSWAANPDAAKSQTEQEASENKARTVPGGASKGVAACHADIERFCRKVTPGEGRIGACLVKNAKKLSKRCRRWAAHGGKEHIGESLIRDIDGTPAPAKK